MVATHTTFISVNRAVLVHKLPGSLTQKEKETRPGFQAHVMYRLLTTSYYIIFESPQKSHLHVDELRIIHMEFTQEKTPELPHVWVQHCRY